MKIINTAVLLLCSCAAFAQIKIDDKYKSPGKQNGAPADFSKIKISAKTTDSVKLNVSNGIKKNFAASEYEKTKAIADAQINEFNIYGDEVWVYEHQFYNGTKKVLKAGQYNLQQLGLFWNDKISSVLVPLKYDVVFYVNDNFQGEKILLPGYGKRNCMQCYSNERQALCFDYGALTDKTIVINGVSQNCNDVTSSIEIKPITLH